MTNTIKLTYLGEDYLNLPVYKDENERLWKDTGMESTKLEPGEKVDKSALCTVSGNEFDGEPYYSMNSIEKYKDAEVELVFKDVQKPSPYEAEYQLLGRLKSDCDYYLGYGHRCEKHLWAGNVKDQIDKMKELWNGFPDGDKPQWLTYDQILQYENEMGQPNT